MISYLQKNINYQGRRKRTVDLDRLKDWAEGNEMKINPNRSKGLNLTRSRAKDPLNYFLGD